MHLLKNEINYKGNKGAKIGKLTQGIKSFTNIYNYFLYGVRFFSKNRALNQDYNSIT